MSKKNIKPKVFYELYRDYSDIGKSDNLLCASYSKEILEEVKNDMILIFGITHYYIKKRIVRK